MDYLEKRISQAQEAIENSEYILIGGGAGLSAAAGLTYSGKRFSDHFSDFMEKYGFTDMYAGTFYPFQTEEELWAHWARHIDVNRYLMPATRLYLDIMELVKNKKYFVISTNVESQFVKAGFPDDKVFEVQGDYSYLQCAKGCHDKLYYNEELIKKMVFHTKECRIPSELVPRCPVCGNEMDVNLRHNAFFVQNEEWYKADKRYSKFLDESEGKNIVYMEFGVGFNTPGIIRYPFEQMTYKNPNATLIRFNRDNPLGAPEIAKKTISFDEDIMLVIQSIGKRQSEQNLPGNEMKNA
ncbi:SIR2 family NAD-dependent protein deacylase [Parasporobacterium paucivorans]|uniref:NAD-dependent protein deacetylase, SIR2 family n=1 Tax=Parasporobacterium paucivorans DSM 15970 TaxID=1122934 RepID=A0A1M6JH74_9FIRM|nr:Sir2 silent information regulator family NAD-dependent deacetylase [Parasporobacterium paucivorans]SHJ46047.1 NAD-dependent protein deacetylase, SIR2 family [Parasporobacterium paucivorans DSM 15970]